MIAGCATAPPPMSQTEIARLQGGAATLVVYGFCVPMDHLIKTTLYRYSISVAVNDQTVGTMQSCGHAYVSS